MRKQIVTQESQNVSAVDQNWLDLDRLAHVQLTSEDPAHPIEAALIPGAGLGWKAAQGGKQSIRLVFDEVQRIRRIQLQIHEAQQARTQEFVLQWREGGGQAYREIVRQQYNFIPPTMADEFEDYAVDLNGVKVLELRIVPDISGGNAVASVASLRLA